MIKHQCENVKYENTEMKKAEMVMLSDHPASLMVHHCQQDTLGYRPDLYKTITQFNSCNRCFFIF